MTLLRTHFDQPGKVEKPTVHAYNFMEQLHYYTKERIFPFSSYVTCLAINTCYTTSSAHADDAVIEQ